MSRIESKVVQDRLDIFNRKIESSNTRRSELLKNKVRSVKAHLSKFDEVLEHNTDINKKKELAYFDVNIEKAKKIEANRKRKRKNIKDMLNSHSKSFTHGKDP